MYWTDLHQIFIYGRHMGGDDCLKFVWPSLKRRCYGNQLIFWDSKKMTHPPSFLFFLL